MQGETRNTRHVMRTVVAVVAIMDATYRLFVREPVRRSLGISSRHA